MLDLSTVSSTVSRSERDIGLEADMRASMTRILMEVTLTPFFSSISSIFRLSIAILLPKSLFLRKITKNSENIFNFAGWNTAYPAQKRAAGIYFAARKRLTRIV